MSIDDLGTPFFEKSFGKYIPFSIGFDGEKISSLLLFRKFHGFRKDGNYGKSR